jgi:hypothetical protein
LFPGVKWRGMQVLFFKCVQMLRRWKIIQKPEVAAQLKNMAGELERRGASPPGINWFPHWWQEASESGPNEDNDARGSSRDSVMTSDVISSRDEYDVVLDHGTDMRSQTFGFETSSDVPNDVLLVSYE